MQKTLPKIKFGKKELTPILTDDGKTVTISWPKGTETTDEQRKIIYEAGFKYDGKAKAIKAPYNAEVKTVLEKLSGAKIDVEPKTEVQTLREIFASNGIDASKPVELPKAPKVSLTDVLDKLKNADDVNADDKTDTSTTDVGKLLCTIRLNGVKGEVRSLPDGRVSLKMEKRVKFTKEEKQAYKKAGFAWKSKEEGSIAENTPALDEFLKKYLVQDASDNNANGNTVTPAKGEKPKQTDNTNKNEVGKADKLPTIQVGGKELNPILRQKDNMVWIAPSDKLPLDVRKSLGQAGFHWDSGGFYYAPYGQSKVKDFLEKHQKDNIGGSKGTPGLDATVTGVENFFKSNGIDTGKTVELPTVPKVSLADLLNKVKNANADNENKGEKSDKKEGSGVDKTEGKSEPIKKELSVDKKTDSDEGEQPIQQQADVETKPDVSAIVKGLNTDDNGLYLMNKKTPADNIELIQKYNEATLLEQVEGICDKWRNGEISIDEASKAVNALKRVYMRSERQVPTVSKDCIEKIEETRKQMFIDREADAKEQHKKQLEAEKKAREEAEAPRKEFYQKALKDAKDAAENVVKQHKEGKMFLEEALDSLEKIKSELEKKLEASKDSSGKGDFLRVDDRKAVYDKQVAAVKKEQEKIDKKILESATTDAMASGESLSKEGQAVYDWVKSSLSNDSKKRFSTNAIEAAAQLLAFRAQTWAELFNKYLGTNYTPLAFAQRYKFAFFDDKIDDRSSSTAGLTTQILTVDEAARGRVAFSGKASTVTLFHEMAHMFFSDFALIAESPLAPQKLKDDFKRLREWIGKGADKTSKEYTQTPYFNSEQRSKSNGEPVDEERFAQAVVKHIADADTPIPWLNKLFTDLKAEIQSYIEKFMLKIKKALGKESEKSKKWANAYTFDFEIPADVKRIINEVVFSGKDEVSKPFAERVKELDDLRSQVDAMLNGDSHVGAVEARDFQMKLANASKGGNEYTSEQNSSLTAARNSIWLEFDEKRAKHDVSVALAEVKNGNTDTNIVAKAASGLIEGKPDELETLPKEALNILDSVLSEQEKEDVADIGRESIAAAVTADYAFDGKLSDDFDALVKGLKDDELSDETIDAVKKYADAMLRALQKYQDLYDKHEAVEEAVKVAKEANDALIVKNKASHVADAPMMENAGDSNKRKDEGNFSVRKSELGEKILRSRDEILEKCKKLFNTDDVQVNDNGTFTITTKGGNKFTLDIQNNLLVNEAEAERARKEHGIADDAEMTIDGYYRPMYSSDVEGIVSVSLDSRENTEAHEATHAAIDLAVNEQEKKILFDRAEKIAKEYGIEKEAEEIAADAVRNFVSAREHGYITDFTKSEIEKLQKTPWGRMMLRANRVGRKAALFSKLHETELQKTAWGRMILAKNKLQLLVAKLMRKVYDFIKKAQAMFEKVDNFHDLARRIELGEVWEEKNLDKNADSGEAKYSARSKPRSQDPGITGINEAYKNKLEEAYAAGAGDNRITAIMNEHQKELAEYLKDKGEKQKERTKLRAAEIRSLRKKLHAKEIESFSLAGAVVRLGKDGKEVVEKIDDGLPNRTYVNKRHEGEKPANVAQKLGSRIAREEPKTRTQKVQEWIVNAKSQFYKHFVDKYDALHLLDDAIAKASGKKIDGANTILGRMNMAANSASGMAMALLEGNADELKQAANKYGIKNMVSLQMLMEKIGTDMKAGRFTNYVKSTNPQGKAELEEHISAIENYLVARSLLESAQNHRLDYDRSVAEWEKKGSHGDKPIFEPYKFPGGMTEQEIRQVIKEAPAGFKEYAKMFKGITDNMLDILYNTGLITGDRYLATKSRYKAYCPLMRDFSDTAAVDSFIDQINSGKGLANVSDPLKNRSSEGSERDIVPPLRTIVTSINALTQKAERNRVGQYAVKQANKYKLDDYIKEVKGNSGDAKNCIFTVMFNGEKHSYQTIPEMYPAITAAVEPLVKIEMALLTKPAQWLRTGSIMSPSFILRNLIRDTLFAGIASKNGFIPIYDSIRGMNALLNNQQLRSEFNASGVISSNFYGDGESVMRSLESMAGGKKWQELGLLDIIKGIFHKPIEGLEWISNLAEAGSRMGEFMRAREKGKSVDQAAYDAVEITLNFGRSGATGQQINRMVPFFNACIQGGDKLYRLYKADPRRTLLRIGTYIVLPSVVLWLWNHDEDWYKELDPNIKMTNWILPNGIRIPKPQEAGILFGSGAEAMLDTANGQDPKAIANWCSQVRDALTPGIIPTLALPLIEWIANYSFFRGKPVVSKSQERLPDELQYGPYTSEMSKALGDNPIMKLSPVKIDNLWRGYTGTMGMFLWQAPDLLIAEKRNQPEKKLSEMAFARDFVVNDMNLTRTMNDFYQLKEEAAKWQAGYGKKGKPTAAVSGVNTAANTISKLQKEIRDITTNPKYTPAQKRMLVDKNRAKQQKVAQLCLKKYGDKFDI